jgi:predicted RNA-binding protein with PUA-like domain
MRYWLFKSDPAVFSIQDLQKAGTTCWDGVRNYKARSFLRAMKKGDRALFCHAETNSCAVMGEMEIVREAYADPTQFDRTGNQFDPASSPSRPRWVQVDISLLKIFTKPQPLSSIKNHPLLQHMVLVRRKRFSIQPVTPVEWETIQNLCSHQ